MQEKLLLLELALEQCEKELKGALKAVEFAENKISALDAQDSKEVALNFWKDKTKNKL